MPPRSTATGDLPPRALLSFWPQVAEAMQAAGVKAVQARTVLLVLLVLLVVCSSEQSMRTLFRAAREGRSATVASSPVVHACAPADRSIRLLGTSDHSSVLCSSAAACTR